MNKMNNQIVFNVKYFFNNVNQEITTNNINELNNIITAPTIYDETTHLALHFASGLK